MEAQKNLNRQRTEKKNKTEISIISDLKHTAKPQNIKQHDIGIRTHTHTDQWNRSPRNKPAYLYSTES